MNTVMPSTARHQYRSASRLPLPPPRRRLRHLWLRLLHPLTAICAVQAALALTLIWSNTAYIDEANYLWIGHLEIAHWLHGTSWPSGYAVRISGSPVIYPPLGALADSVCGLAGARILSLIFMLGATILLYFTASRLIGRTGAIFASAIWALSEPAIRLAFATFDPLSVLLTTLSAWLIVQAGYRRRRGALVAASAAALALANATAYSGIVVDPLVILFAFLVWLPRMPAKQAWFFTAWLTGGLVIAFGLVMTVTHSWVGTTAVFDRQSKDHQSLVLVLYEIWEYAGLIIVLAVIGAIVAIAIERRRHAALLALLGCATFWVPAAQLHDQTAWSLDKHLAYGFWFAAIAAGYGCSKLIRWLPGSRRFAATCCLIALAYPAATSWESAWQRFHAWPDASTFISAFEPVAARAQGLIYVPGHEANIAQYYTPEGRNWTQWSAALALNPAGLPTPIRRSNWDSYYTADLHNGNYGVIALFYSATFSSAPELPGRILVSPNSNRTYQKLLGLVGDNSGEPGLSVLTQVLEKDPEYHLDAVGRYDSAHNYSIYAIWRKAGT